MRPSKVYQTLQGGESIFEETSERMRARHSFFAGHSTPGAYEAVGGGV